MFKNLSPKYKAYLVMLQNAEPFLDKYKKITGYNKFEEFKESLKLKYKKNNHKFANFNEYCYFVRDTYDYDIENYFLFCYSHETKELKNKVRYFLDNKKINYWWLEENQDKLYWYEIEECFKEKHYPNMITDMFESNLKKDWLFKEKIYSFFNTIFHIILVIAFIILITSPIWLQIVMYGI